MLPNPHREEIGLKHLFLHEQGKKKTSVECIAEDH
jgi:hypothetical protein